MRERDIRHSVSQAHAADGALQSHLSPEPFDGETADKEDDARLQERELILEPWCAERDLGRRRPTIAAPGPRLPREAFRDRRAIWKMVFVDSRFRQPAPQLRAGATAERLPGRELDLTWSLTDDRDPIADGSGHDWLCALEVPGIDTFRACPDAGVKKRECTGAIDHANNATWSLKRLSGSARSEPSVPPRSVVPRSATDADAALVVRRRSRSHRSLAPV